MVERISSCPLLRQCVEFADVLVRCCSMCLVLCQTNLSFVREKLWENQRPKTDFM